MEKKWIWCHDKLSDEYTNGVKSFIELAKHHLDEDNRTRCPCRYCRNVYFQDISVVERHLWVKGFSPDYHNWIYHGEALNFQGIEMGFEEDDEVVEHDREEDDNDDIRIALQDAAGDMDIDVDAYEGHIGDQDHRNKEFSGLFAEVESELYPGCTKFSALTFLVRLMHIKALNHWSNKSFSMLLELLKEALPEGTKLPKSYYKAKSELDKCPICAEPRYKFQGTKGKRIPQKVLRYFPITPRLQRLFTSRHTAIDMRWHKEKRPNTNGVLRHPADGEAWKHFDEQYPIFAMDPRNVRVGAAIDGFNHFSNMSTSYSMWPVMLVPYNLPPWKCMKETFSMMSLLIPGPTAPGKDIDVYLRPMIDELKDLWTNGVTTCDISKKERFTMHAAVLWTIHDFPAYGTLSRWSTKGYKACPTCNEDTSSQALRSKICYMGHRRYLSINHAWRNNRQYDGKPERRLAPRQFSGAEILQQLDRTIESRPGKHPNNVDKKRKRAAFGTMLDIKGKSKDIDKARMDLKDLNIRKELHLQETGGKVLKPLNVNIKDGKISGLKTHDSHVLLQQLFPVGIRPYIKKEVCGTIIEMCMFFQKLCARTLFVSDLDMLQERIILTLCKLERIFPPAFFDIMVHLAVHLPYEAKMAGPVHTRWMYPFERNKAHPEGSIAEGYVVNEALTYCSMYLHGIETRFNRPERNKDGENQIASTLSVFTQPVNLLGKPQFVELKDDDYKKAHCEHTKLLQNRGVTSILQIKYFSRCKYPMVTDELYSLACGPDYGIRSYSGCVINGVRYRTKVRDDRRVTQNCGIWVVGDHDGESCDFYGVIEDILVLDYRSKHSVVLFRCAWFDTNVKKKKMITEFQITSINVTSYWYKNDPFVLASQAKQVFYVDDYKMGQHWKVVRKVHHRHLWDFPDRLDEGDDHDSEVESGDFEDADSGAESEDYEDADTGTENEDNGEYNEETDNDSEDELLSNGETGEDTDSFA
ncbi:uncharacterized protein LOC132803267 [Ziziphus jujuba]|uniref:Uncharacterized protein LOC132803267 n=1 Tax=Ziziphus jujuba TaxID=326968 RepID=A0ABM4A540_ZIZJJ|nr:uncharacterized protein LOC132803267 [Ziziphus jujuba]